MRRPADFSHKRWVLSMMSTAFQERVYAAVRRIPRGRVMTYAGVARAVGCGSCQAVGQALKHNPYAPEVPCHRVIASALTLGGFQGRRAGPALARKLKLLEAEGVRFRAGRLIEPERVWCGTSLS
jgi:methylated-DNA-[protein]-cysteine S-methyltransferase